MQALKGVTLQLNALQIDEDSKSRRTAASRQLRNALASNVPSENIDRRIYLRLPAVDGHSDHPRGEVM